MSNEELHQDQQDHDDYLDNENENENNSKVQVYDDDDAYMLNDANKDYNDGENDFMNMEDNKEDDQLPDHDENEHFAAEDYNDQDARLDNRNEEVRGKDAELEEYTDRQYMDKEAEQDLDEEQNPNPEKLSNLITLNYISVCQYCKENFNSMNHLPYLLKCGHFFCKACILNNFTNKKTNQIICPDDGSKAASLNELKVLNNLITGVSGRETANKMNNFVEDSEFCKIHQGQKLSHYVEETKEIICVYCAFNRFKKNPNADIKEVTEKCSEINDDLGKIFEDNQTYLEEIKEQAFDAQQKKKEEDKKVNNLFDSINKFLEEKRREALDGINNLFSQNVAKLNEKQNFVISKLEQSENLKVAFENVMSSNIPGFFEEYSKYKHFVSDVSNTGSYNFDLSDYKFVHEDTNKLMRYITNFADLKVKQKMISYNPKNFRKGVTANPGLTSSTTSIPGGKRQMEEHFQFKVEREQQERDRERDRERERFSADPRGKISKTNNKTMNHPQHQQANEVLNTSELKNEQDERDRYDNNHNPRDEGYQKAVKSYNAEFSQNIERLKKDLNKFNLGGGIGGGSIGYNATHTGGMNTISSKSKANANQDAEDPKKYAYRNLDISGNRYNQKGNETEFGRLNREMEANRDYNHGQFNFARTPDTHSKKQNYQQSHNERDY